MKDELILKKSFAIYNNQASSENSSGRLSVTYDIYPAPAIFWEYETFGKDTLNPNPVTGELSPFIGHQFEMPKPFRGATPNKNPLHYPMGYWTCGSAPRVIVGDKDLLGKSFSFVLPNAIFHKVAWLKNSCAKDVIYRSKNTVLNRGSNQREGFVKATLQNNIELTMYTPIEALDWLGSYISTGTFITTSGTLDVDNDISILDAVKLLEEIANLLSFANGGFVAPLLVSMSPQEPEKYSPCVYSAYEVDPVEHAGAAWVSRKTEIATLLECLPALQKMLQTQYWDKNFFHILTWYFQAIQPQDIQHRGKPWPIVANALGAALEKLASIILVEETKAIKSEVFFGDRKQKIPKMHLDTCIEKLLEFIGISYIPTYESKKATQLFAEMRNDATHSKSNHTWSQGEVDVILGNAIQWVEETLLWRLGYQGIYRDRSRGNEFTTSPRYDLTKRDSAW